MSIDFEQLQTFDRGRLEELDQRVDRELGYEVQQKKDAIQDARQKRLKKALKRRKADQQSR